MISSTCFKPEGLSSGRWLYAQLWYNLYMCHWCKQSSGLLLVDCLYHWHVNTLHNTCTYNSLPADEPSYFKFVEGIAKIRIFV